MNVKNITPVTAILVLLLLVGCGGHTSVMSARNDSGNQYSTAYIVRNDQSTRDIDVMIARALMKRGIETSIGTREQQPNNVDFVVTYSDRWKWDISMYLLSLDIQFTDPSTRKILAMADYKNSKLHGYPNPEKTVRSLVQKMLGSAKKEKRD